MNPRPVPLPTGTVTFLYTDIEDSTRVAQQYPAELPALLGQHDAILRGAIAAAGGYVFRQTGDGFCAAFFTATQALHAALQAQRRFQQADWRPARLKVRMGVHTGPAQPAGEQGQAGDYTGYLTLARAQRVMSTAHGGQVLVSAASAELLREELPEGVELRDLGQHRLKGLLNLEHLWQIAAPDLPAEFPPLPALDTVPNNLPLQLSSFIGREREIAEATRLLRTARLLTLTGVGGVGKTRLCLQAAAEALDDFKDGAWLVELAPLADPALLTQSAAAVLGVREAPGRPLSITLLDYLRAKNLLLLLDNCEHLIEACAELAGRILSACPHVRILASSREALGILGETTLQVPSLALPDLPGSALETNPGAIFPDPHRAPGYLDTNLGATVPGPQGAPRLSLAEVARAEAVQLFLERARAVQPGFASAGQAARQESEQLAATLAHICRRLDGIPLAIELAAARVKMFSAEQILTRLDDRFRLLTGGSRTALPRQQTLRAMIDWSYDLLSNDERVTLRRLSVFAGGWTFEAAEAVAGDPSLDLLDLLARLIEKSLVTVEEIPVSEPPHHNEARYRFLETIRQYAGEKLLESGEAAGVRDRHLDFFLQFAERAEPHVLSPAQVGWLDRIEVEHDNLRAALAWGLENNPPAALRLAAAVWNFWTMRGYAGEGRGWLAKSLGQLDALPEPSGEAAHEQAAARAKALLGSGILMISQGDHAEGMKAFLESAAWARRSRARPALARALALYGTAEAFLGRPITNAIVREAAAVSREIGDPLSLATALGMLSSEARAAGDLQAANAYSQEIRGLSLEHLDPWNTGMALLGFGFAAAQVGDYAEARTRFEACLPLFRTIGDKYRVTMVQSELAHLERRQGRILHSLPLYRQTILAWQHLGNRAAIAHQLECFAFIAADQGNARRAAQLLGAAEALRAAKGSTMTSLEREEYGSAVAAVHRSLGEASFAEAWSRGRAMAMEDAIACALEPLEVEACP